MSSLLQKAFDEASRLPDDEQEALAAILLEELQSERRWRELLSGDHDATRRLAQEALDEHRNGLTEEMTFGDE